LCVLASPDDPALKVTRCSCLTHLHQTQKNQQPCCTGLQHAFNGSYPEGSYFAKKTNLFLFLQKWSHGTIHVFMFIWGEQEVVS
jgi:hypothetical protein